MKGVDVWKETMTLTEISQLFDTKELLKASISDNITINFQKIY